MPGITGIIKRKPYEGIRQDLCLMMESMRHERFYVSNQYVNEDLGIYIGWLSHPGSLGEHMPLISSDKQRMLILGGELFPQGNGAKPSDADRDATAHNLLRLYEESGDKFLERLNGWFCGIAVDLNLGKVTLFNDRYAMSRIYLHEGQEEFIFASEAKALLRIRPSLRAIEPGALAQYLRFNCVMGNKTLFKDISLLPSASAWSFIGSTVPHKQNYFDFANWEEQPTLPISEFFQKFEATASKVIPAYMEGEEPVAMSLTAGLDTRAILASAGDHDGPLPCYTFGGLWGETFDIQMARKLAAVCHQPHEIIRINENFLQDFPSYAEKSVYLSDGSHDAFGAHDVYFNQIARNIAPVRLTGKFGSEIVRNRKLIHLVNFPRHILRPSFAPFLDEALSFDQTTKREHPLTRVLTEVIPWYEYGRVAVEQSEVTLRTPYMDNELVRLMYQAPLGLRASRELQEGYIKQRRAELADLPTDMGKMGKDGEAMTKVAFGFYWALAKSEYIYLYALPHWLTWVDRKLGRLRPERILVGRQKFEAYRIWTKTHFAGSIRNILLNPQAHCTDFFDKDWVTRAVERHAAGTHNYLNEINRMLTVELIYSSLFKW